MAEEAGGMLSYNGRHLRENYKQGCRALERPSSATTVGSCYTFSTCMSPLHVSPWAALSVADLTWDQQPSAKQIHSLVIYIYVHIHMYIYTFTYMFLYIIHRYVPICVYISHAHAHTHTRTYLRLGACVLMGAVALKHTMAMVTVADVFFTGAVEMASLVKLCIFSPKRPSGRLLHQGQKPLCDIFLKFNQYCDC